jgi:hypothetical protein
VHKLNLQATFLEKYLNLPKNFGKEALASAVYKHFSFDDLCHRILDEEPKIQLSFFSQCRKLSFLLINEIEDHEIINKLHEDIEKMALRLEEMVIINITRIQLISLLYKLFKLDYESKYMIEAKEIDLKWQQYFHTLTDNKSVLFSDIQVNSVQFRLIATKFNLNEISVKTFIEQIKSEVKKSEHEAYEDLESHVNWFSRSVALLTKPMSKSSYEIPKLFKIDSEKYVVFGFPHSLELVTPNNECLPKLDFLIKDTNEKQRFILNFEQEKLTLECQVVDGAKGEEVRFSSFCHQIRNNLLSHKDACVFPINFTNGYCFFWFRPYSGIDFIENSL